MSENEIGEDAENGMQGMQAPRSIRPPFKTSPLKYYAKQNIMQGMISSFRCKDTERLFTDRVVPRFGAIERSARRKLLTLHRATDLNDLQSPSGNRLEALKGDRAGQHSIRINDQWRICFIWDGQNAQNVEIVDYH